MLADTSTNPFLLLEWQLSTCMTWAYDSNTNTGECIDSVVQEAVCNSIFWCNVYAFPHNVCVIWWHFYVSVASEDSTKWVEEGCWSQDITSLHHKPHGAGSTSHQWAQVILWSKSLGSNANLFFCCLWQMIAYKFGNMQKKYSIIMARFFLTESSMRIVGTNRSKFEGFTCMFHNFSLYFNKTFHIHFMPQLNKDIHNIKKLFIMTLKAEETILNCLKLIVTCNNTSK